MTGRIALVEDNPDNRLLVRAILEDLYEIDEYETGAAALDGIAATPPDLILLDISLPGMDGTEVLRILRDRPECRKVPVVALTAHAMQGDRDRFFAMGFNAYITKPIVNEHVLVEEIQRLIARRSPLEP